MRNGNVGVIIQADQSDGTFEVRAPNGKTQWYRENEVVQVDDATLALAIPNVGRTATEKLYIKKT